MHGPTTREPALRPLDPGKFQDPLVTAKGELRASVTLRRLETLWFNTGTLCNIECANCYIDSSPRNDRLAYLTASDVSAFLDEAGSLTHRPATIGFTGGEPFMNPAMPDILEDTLARGYDTLVLTNAMKPMMRPRVQAAIARLTARHGPRLTLRISLDHWREDLHDEERGTGSFRETLDGMKWLASVGTRMAVAGRLRWGGSDADMRSGYAALFATEALPVDAQDPSSLVIFPEMDATADVPEITTECWSILGKSPSEMMCASSRMVVRHRGATKPSVVACTLLPYEKHFSLGETLSKSAATVMLNHPHCAKFCVLGGGSCKA